MPRAAITIVFLTILLGSLIVVAYDASPTGYYLPKGYKVSVKLHVPGAPFWPGEVSGDIAGVGCEEYSVLIIGYGWKGQLWEGYPAESGIKVIWKQGGNEEEKAKEKYDEGDYDVTIVYGCDGQIKISVNGEFLYGFVATKSKYSILAEGAAVQAPEPLPCITETTTDPGTGEGYNPPSVNEMQQQLLWVGIGVIALIAFPILFLRVRK